MILLLACFAPTVNLISVPSTVLSPIDIQRNQDIYVDSAIQVNCNLSQTIKVQWSLINCTGSVCGNVLPPHPSILTSYTDLYVPSKTLPLGAYQFRLTVAMAVRSNLSSSASVYVRIVSAGVTANLFQYGTSMISSGVKQDLELNPGRHSVDLDGNQLNVSVSVRLSYVSLLLHRIFLRIGITNTIVESTE